MLAKLLAGILGLMAFAVCLIGGLSAAARAEVVIVRGLKAMIVFCLLGWIVGWAAETVIYEQVRKEAHEAQRKKAQREQEAPPADDVTVV